ncbi:MAG: vWA domain-containing protein [Candidatus Acidiferrales bacterium]
MLLEVTTMRRGTILACCAGVFFVVSRPAIGQDPCSRALVPVSLLAKPAATLNLTPANFKATMKHSSLSVVSVRPNTDAHRVVVLLDASGSMGGADRTDWISALHTAKQLLRDLPASTEVGLTTFSDVIDTKFPLTTDRDPQVGWLDATAGNRGSLPKGETALWASIRESLAVFGAPRLADTLIVITDGDDNVGKVREKELDQALLRSGVRLFAVIQSSRELFIEAGTDLRAGPDQLRDLSLESGGMSFSRDASSDPDKFRKTADGSMALDELARLVTNDFVLEVDLGSPHRELVPWKLELQHVPTLKHTEFQVFYPHKIAGCLAESNAAATKVQ